jgi:hypothetical protein
MYCIIDKNAVLLSKTLEHGQTWENIDVVLGSCVAGEVISMYIWRGVGGVRG